MSEEANKTDCPPDRLSVFEGKPFYDAAVLRRGIRVWINDVEHLDDVVEYCCSGKWARIKQKNPPGHPKAGEFMKNLYGTGPKIKRVENLVIRVEWK